MNKSGPYFIWDYNLTEKDVRRILKQGNEYERTWLIGRILESAKYEDIWKYISLDKVITFFPKLRLKKQVRSAWEKAFKAWGVSPYSYEDSHKKSG